MKNTYKSFLFGLVVILTACGSPTGVSSGTQSNADPSSSISASETKEGTYHFYCVNDFHGSILERNGNNYEAGIAKYFGELKRLKEKDPEHTVILSAGDMYQGSLESNSNYGKLITEAMNEVGFEAMTIGNHEFDYGQDKLLENVELANFPFLAGNIMKYKDGAATTTRWMEDKVGLSTVIEKGDAKIGIVGVIGEGQTTSITSKYVSDITFVGHEELTKNEAARLRSEEGCDIVLLLIHDEMANSRYAANKKYFDGVFCAHTHDDECQAISRVPFVQSFCNGRAMSKIDITLDGGSAYCSDYRIINSTSSWEEDEKIAAIRDSYIEDGEFKLKATAKAGYVDGFLAPKEGVPNIICKAIYEKYAPKEDNLVCTMVNGQRYGLSGGVTFSDIYKATPFMNKIVIANVKGEDIIKEAYYNHTYTGDLENYRTINSSSFYKVAIIDYILCHQGLNKTYDYFYSLNPGRGGTLLVEYEDYPFDLVFDYIKNDLQGQVDANDYTDYSTGFNLYA
ncbi:MAG: metallophosphatase [Bacilli bacterium]|nr:metallophosphatase [Bacilli bacterium]